MGHRQHGALMFGALVLFLLFGYPVAFALAANGIVFGLLGIELGLLQPHCSRRCRSASSASWQRHAAGHPLLHLHGADSRTLGHGGRISSTPSASSSARSAAAWPMPSFRRRDARRHHRGRGRLGDFHGPHLLPIMLRYGYDRLASGVIAASGTLAQIIPPSLVLIIMADQLGKSVGDMYEGPWFPVWSSPGLYVGYVPSSSASSPAAPALPPEARSLRAALKLMLRVLTTLVPPLVLIFLVLGTIFLGIATPTEGGAMRAAGA